MLLLLLLFCIPRPPPVVQSSRRAFARQCRGGPTTKDRECGDQGGGKPGRWRSYRPAFPLCAAIGRRARRAPSIPSASPRAFPRRSSSPRRRPTFSRSPRRGLGGRPGLERVGIAAVRVRMWFCRTARMWGSRRRWLSSSFRPSYRYCGFTGFALAQRGTRDGRASVCPPLRPSSTLASRYCAASSECGESLLDVGCRRMDSEGNEWYCQHEFLESGNSRCQFSSSASSAPRLSVVSRVGWSAAVVGVCVTFCAGGSIFCAV